MSNNIFKFFNMGTAASSHVKTIDIDQNSDKFDRPRSSKAAKEKKELARDAMIKQQQSDLDSCRKELATSNNQIVQYETELKQLEYLLSEAESKNHDLNDRIQVLEEEIEMLHNDKLKAAPLQDYSETLKIKDQCIEKLERETNAVQEEIAKLKSKNKKKIRSVHKQLAESKQETLLKVFELKDEISKMSEENARLLEKLERVKSAPAGSRSKHHDSDQSQAEDVGRTKVILELSQQVSQQDGTINSLERKVIEKDHLIQELRMMQRTKSSKSKSPSPQESPKSSKETIYGHQSHSASATCPRTSHQSTEHRSVSASHTRVAVNEETEDLKDIAVQINKMTKRKAKRKENDCRESSGISRDSGIVVIEDSGIVVTEDCLVTEVTQTKLPKESKISKRVNSAKSISSLDSNISSDVDNACVAEPSKHRRHRIRQKKNHHHKTADENLRDLDDLLKETKCLQNTSFGSSNVHSVKVS